MLSQSTITTIKATVPALEAYGTEITKAFYKKLFEKHPQLLNIFNHTNQQKGRQQNALATTVLAAAKYIDQLEVLLPAVKQIAHKHRSLQVQPEHYPVVGETLLWAIKEVLGEAATDEILNAWGEAYGVIADIFISVEKAMYEEAAAELGWEGYKSFIISKKVKESENITSFYLTAGDGSKLPSFNPGQYITVRVSIPGEQYLLNRQYSLTALPNEDHFRISVKREAIDGSPAGKVSNYLHDFVNEGDSIEVTAPAGDFTIDLYETKPIHFIAGGVGITPFMSMLHTLADKESQRDITVIHAVQNEQVQAFHHELATLQNKLSNFGASFYYESGDRSEKLEGFQYAAGRVTEETLQHLDTTGIYYVCGPVPFMQSVVSALYKSGVSEEQVKYEFFGPAIAIQ